MRHLCMLVYSMLSLVFVVMVISSVGSYIEETYFTHFFNKLYVVSDSMPEMSEIIEMSNNYIEWLVGFAFFLFVVLLIPAVIAYVFQKRVFLSFIFTIIISLILWIIVFEITYFFTNRITDIIEMSNVLYTLYTVASVAIGILTLGIVYIIINLMEKKEKKISINTF